MPPAFPWLTGRCVQGPPQEHIHRSIAGICELLAIPGFMHAEIAACQAEMGAVFEICLPAIAAFASPLSDPFVANGWQPLA